MINHAIAITLASLLGSGEQTENTLARRVWGSILTACQSCCTIEIIVYFASSIIVQSSSVSPNKLSNPSAFTHFLWRKHARPRVFKGALPEVLATDGTCVRRLASQPNQIVFQHFEDGQTASTLVRRIEASITPGVAIIGYSMFEQHRSVAILNTGTQNNPGWLAFPDAKTEEGAAAFSGQFSSTLPTHVANQPKLRLVTGGSVAWENRKLVIKAALEQRGSSFLKSAHAFHLLDHLVSWELHTIVFRDGKQRAMQMCESTSTGGIIRVHPLRAEASFLVEPYLYKEFKHLDGQIWIKLKFDRELFCLPEDWSSFWMVVDVQEPAGMLF